MSVAARRRTFLLSAAAVAGFAALAWALPPSPDAVNRAPTAPIRPLVTSAGQTERPASQARVSSQGSLAGPRATARKFARSFLRRQAGDPSGRVEAPLAATSSASLRRYLADEPVRGLSAAPRAELRSLRVYALRRGQTKGSALVRYGRTDGLLEFLLERTRGGWRVTELYP